ncbi:MAG: ribosome-associated translation inhibitor RaiA [Alphaproteobacteria bacterium]|nr:ribosome-associated translation inhibitor RaiA [Alphaproteobacteria bacterium]
MQIHIHGHHMNTGAALRTHVETRIADLIEKYFPKIEAEANITFSKQGSYFEVANALHLDSGLYLHASASAADVYQSFDQSLARLEKQLRRYKRRLKNHHKAPPPSAASMTAEKIFAPEAVSIEGENDEAQAEFVPVIIAEDNKIIPTLTMSEAVMQLEVGRDDFVIFKTRANKDAPNKEAPYKEGSKSRKQLIYRRSDKNIGWMELD